MKSRFSFLLTVLALAIFGCVNFVAGCASVPESQALREVRVGMTKQQVLGLAGNPLRVDRRLNQDRWTYQTHVVPKPPNYNPPDTTYIFFANGRVTYVGQPNKIHKDGGGPGANDDANFHPVGQ